MFTFWKDRALQLQLRIEQDLRERLTNLQSELSARDAEIELLQGKIDLMEQVLMPLSSAAGAAYTRLQHPSTVAARWPGSLPQPQIETSWQRELKNHMKKIDEEIKDGLQGERRDPIHEQTAS